MYFDDICMKNTEPVTRVSEYSARILEFCEEDPCLREEIEKDSSHPIRQLKKRMNETTDPLDILRELTEKIPFSTTKKFIEFQELLNAFWNLSSRDEFSGMSPQQKTEEMRGPRERELIHDLMRHISTTVKPDKFSSKKDLQKEIEKHKKRWLSEPQPELNYMSPWEVILKERKKLGSPIKDFGVTISVASLMAGQGGK